jgi:hypothetical protein
MKLIDKNMRLRKLKMNNRNDETYNGWKNYETWNVSLWIQNDEFLYDLAMRCKDYSEFKSSIQGGFAQEFMKLGLETPDGVSWNDSGLDIEALNKMIGEL